MNVATTNLPSGKSRERAEVVILVALLQERRRDHEAERRHGDEPADHAAEAERRDLEELRARVALAPAARRRARPRRRRRRRRGALGLDLGRLGERGAGASGRAPRGSAKTSAMIAPSAGDPPARRSGRRAARPRRRRSRPARGSGPERAGGRRGGCKGAQAGFKRSGTRLVNVVTGGANSDGSAVPLPREPSRSIDRTRPSGGRRARGSRRSSRSPAATRARPRRALRGRVDADLAADELQRRRVVEVVERAFGDHDVALRDRRSRRRRTSPAA